MYDVEKIPQNTPLFNLAWALFYKFLRHGPDSNDL